MKTYKINESFKSKIGVGKIPCFENFISEKYGVELVDGDTYKTTEDIKAGDSEKAEVILPAGTKLTYKDEQGTFSNNQGTFVSDYGYFECEDGQQYDPEVLLSNESIEKAEAEGGEITEITEEQSEAIVDDKVIEGGDVEQILTDSETVTDEVKQEIIDATNALEGDAVSVGDLVEVMVEKEVPAKVVADVIDNAVESIVDSQDNINEACKDKIKESINESVKKRYRKAIFESKKSKRKINESNEDDFVALLMPSEDFNNFKTWFNENYDIHKSDDELEEIFGEMEEGTGNNELYLKYSTNNMTPKEIRKYEDRGFTYYFVDPQEAKENNWSVDNDWKYGDRL